MIESYVPASSLPKADPDTAAATAEAECTATLAVLTELTDQDWDRPTDCDEWDVRAMVSHLVAQFEDSVSIRTMARRQLTGRRRHRGKNPVDAHMAVQIDEHAATPGPALVARFAELRSEAVRKRRALPALMRAIAMPGAPPGGPRLTFGHLSDVIYTRDLWMHRVDLTRATGRPMTLAGHDPEIVALTIRDLALAWTGDPLLLQLTGPAGGTWLLGSGDPAATVRGDAVAYMRALSGRDDDVPLELLSGGQSALRAARDARALF